VGDQLGYEFTGKERDETADVVTFGFRALLSRCGRWIAPDRHTQHSLAGDRSAYRYSGSNPLRLVDPDGADIYVYDAPEFDIKQLEGASSAQYSQILHDAIGTIHGLSPQLRPASDAQAYLRYAMEVQADALGGGEALVQRLMSAFDSTGGLSVGLMDGAAAVREDLRQLYDAKDLVVFEQFYQAAEDTSAVVIVRVRDNATAQFAAFTEAADYTSVGSHGREVRKHGVLVVVPEGGAWSMRTASRHTESDLVCTEIVEHAGGAAVGEDRNQWQHGRNVVFDMLVYAHEEGLEPSNPFGWSGAQAAFDKVRPHATPADERALAWGLATFNRAQQDSGTGGGGDAGAGAPAAGSGQKAARKE
jgi:RHS repeat-associated protein